MLWAVMMIAMLAWCTHQPDTNLTDGQFEHQHAVDMASKDAQEQSWSKVGTVELLAPTNAQQITTGSVEYTTWVQWYLAQPVNAPDAPGVVIIHERRWLNDNIKQMAEVLAMNGYKVLAVDLYNGQVAVDMDQAKTLSSSLDQEASTRNLLAAEQYLRSLNSTKVASLWWCLWGKQSLELSAASESLDATIVYYGRLPTSTGQIATINRPLLGIFAELDNGIPPASVNAFEQVLGSQWASWYDITIYSGVNHAFANPTGQAFAKEATLDAWRKTLEFLKTNLGS